MEKLNTLEKELEEEKIKLKKSQINSLLIGCFSSGLGFMNLGIGVENIFENFINVSKNLEISNYDKIIPYARLFLGGSCIYLAKSSLKAYWK